MLLAIKKIKHIPFQISNEDEILMDNLTRDEVPGALESLGFGKHKEKIVDGVKVHYKSKRNGVYLSYKK